MAVHSLEPVQPAALRLAFDPDLASARAVSAAIRLFLAEQGVAERELFSYELCIAEASNNAIEYAEGPFRALRPIAEALLTPTQIEMRVTDHTAGFVLPQRIPPPSPLTDRGRGLFLIQSVMDEVRYLRGENENVLVMLKMRRPARASVSARGQVLSPSPSIEGWRHQLERSRVLAANVAEGLEHRLGSLPFLRK